MKKMKIALSCLLAAATLPAFGVTVQKDVVYATAPTVLLEGFGGTVDPSTALTKVGFDSIGGGVANYTYAANTGPEGTITYNPLATTFNPATYHSVRVRMSVNRDDGAATTATQVYPTPISAATGHIDASIPSGSTLVERSFDLTTTSNPNGNGLRLDAFNYTNDGTADSTAVDYIMADMGRTIGYEFGHDGDLNSTTAKNASLSVANGLLSGTDTSGDSQIYMIGNGAPNPTISADIYKYVEIRMKGTAGDRIDFFWSTPTRGSVTPKVDVDAAADGNWHTYLLDFSDEVDWTGNLNFARLDPVASNGATFDVDSVRFMETIPEPATLGMVALLGGGMLWIRRRFMI